eukprot:3964880-Lingulodinium_polyedra.AAC.1
MPGSSRSSLRPPLSRRSPSGAAGRRSRAGSRSKSALKPTPSLVNLMACSANALRGGCAALFAPS